MRKDNAAFTEQSLQFGRSNYLPSGWKWKRLKELCEPSQYGWTTRASSSGDVKLLRTTDISSGRIDWSTVPFCETAPGDVQKYRVYPGDIFISRAGSVGKSFLIETAENSVFASYLIRYRPKVNQKYIYYFLQSSYYWSQVSEQTAGIAIPNINASKLDRVVVAMAPPEVQRLVVAQIDALFSELDDAERALGEARAGVGTYRRALLKAAVTGELTAERRRTHPPAESGQDLLRRILAERRSAWQADPKNHGRRYVEPAGPDTEGLPELPEGWCWASMDQLTTRITKGSSPNWQGFDYQAEGILFIRSQNVGWNRLLLHERVYLDPSFNEREKKAVIKEGDVLLNLVGASIGRAAVADSRLDGANSNQAVAGIRPIRPHSFSKFMCLWLNSHDVQARIQADAVDVARANFSLDQTRRLPVPVPSETEMSAIASQYDSAVSLLGAEEMSSFSRDVATLRQSILAAAFRGDLCP